MPRDPYPAHSGINYGTCYEYDVPVITPMGGRVVFAGWSEVALGRLRPDALAWGMLFGREALFWLEVESGKALRQELRGKIIHRFEGALCYAWRFSLSLVFALLAPFWVLRAVAGGFVGLPGDAAVVLADWKGFGALPVPG